MTKETLTKQVICPRCYRPLQCPATLLNEQIDKYQRNIRTYLGWCFKCNLGCEVVQFSQDGKWCIHKYQHYTLTKHDIHCHPTGEWTTVQSLSEPSPVITGPGGDFNQQHNFDTEAFNLLHKLKGAMSQTLNVIDQLITEWAKKSDE